MICCTYQNVITPLQSWQTLILETFTRIRWLHTLINYAEEYLLQLRSPIAHNSSPEIWCNHRSSKVYDSLYPNLMIFHDSLCKNNKKDECLKRSQFIAKIPIDIRINQKENFSYLKRCAILLSVKILHNVICYRENSIKYRSYDMFSLGIY